MDRYILAAMASLAVLWALVSQGLAFSAHRHVCCDEDWYARATPTEVRRVAHRALELWFSDPHDEMLVLMRDGDASSVPRIRRALRRAGDDELCTWAHARDALTAIESRQ